MTDPKEPEIPIASVPGMETPQPTEPLASAVARGSQRDTLAGAPGWERATLEKLAFAALEEQRVARRWRTFVRLSWLVLLAVVVWAVINRSGPSANVSTPHTALVEIKGEIEKIRQQTQP